MKRAAAADVVAVPDLELTKLLVVVELQQQNLHQPSCLVSS